MVIAVVDKARKGIALEARSKADFGAAVVRNKAKEMVGVTSNQDRLYHSRTFKFRRVVNVIKPSNLKPDLHCRSGKGRTLEGVYEKWSTTPFCTTSNRRQGGLEIDIKNPYLAMQAMVKSDKEISTGMIELGKIRTVTKYLQKFEPNTSQRRSIRFYRLIVFQLSRALTIPKQDQKDSSIPILMRNSSLTLLVMSVFVSSHWKVSK